MRIVEIRTGTSEAAVCNVELGVRDGAVAAEPDGAVRDGAVAAEPDGALHCGWRQGRGRKCLHSFVEREHLGNIGIEGKLVLKYTL